MEKRKISIETKMAIVLEGLKEKKTIVDICKNYRISQSQYYRYRDQFLEAGQTGLSNGQKKENNIDYKERIAGLEQIIGKLITDNTDVLKKNFKLV